MQSESSESSFACILDGGARSSHGQKSPSAAYGKPRPVFPATRAHGDDIDGPLHEELDEQSFPASCSYRESGPSSHCVSGRRSCLRWPAEIRFANRGSLFDPFHYGLRVKRFILIACPQDCQPVVVRRTRYESATPRPVRRRRSAVRWWSARKPRSRKPSAPATLYPVTHSCTCAHRPRQRSSRTLGSGPGREPAGRFRLDSTPSTCRPHPRPGVAQPQLTCLQVHVLPTPRQNLVAPAPGQASASGGATIAPVDALPLASNSLGTRRNKLRAIAWFSKRP